MLYVFVTPMHSNYCMLGIVEESLCFRRFKMKHDWKGCVEHGMVEVSMVTG